MRGCVNVRSFVRGKKGAGDGYRGINQINNQTNDRLKRYEKFGVWMYVCVGDRYNVKNRC